MKKVSFNTESATSIKNLDIDNGQVIPNDPIPSPF